MTKNGGRLSGSGSVDWVFESRGVIISPKSLPESIDSKSQRQVSSLKSEEIEMAAIDAGAADIDDTADSLTIYTAPDQVMKVKKTLEDQEIKIESAEISLEPKNTVEISDAAIAHKILKLMEALEDYEDVVSVSANFDIPEELMEKISLKDAT
jgi:transcriptional/translational regulatory protein YebC/TACO1